MSTDRKGSLPKLPAFKKDSNILSHEQEVIHESTDNANNRRDNYDFLRKWHARRLQILERSLVIFVRFWMPFGLSISGFARGFASEQPLMLLALKKEVTAS